MTKILKIILILVVAAFIAGAFIFSRQSPGGTIEQPAEAPSAAEFSALPIFSQGLSAAGVELDELGYHTFSPDGKYFLFTGIKNSDTIPAKTYLMNVSTGEVKLLPGIMLRGFEDSRIITLFNTENELVLYEISTGASEEISTDGNVFAGALSPDGKYYVFDTLQGIKIYNRENKTTETISPSQYDGASAWFSDSKRMLGFKDNGESIFEAGNARQFGVWDVTTKNFSPLAEGKIPPGPVRNSFWIIPDKLARVNTGWDDGSHDYIFDVGTGEVIDLGDTSSALMGGMKEDASLSLFAIVSGYADLGQEVKASVYKGTQKISSAVLSGGYFRENIQIVDQNSLLYVRKHMNEKQSIDAVALVKLDMGTGIETVIRELDAKAYSIVSLHPDRKTWVVSSKDKFITGKLE